MLNDFPLKILEHAGRGHGQLTDWPEKETISRAVMSERLIRSQKCRFLLDNFRREYLCTCSTHVCTFLGRSQVYCEEASIVLEMGTLFWCHGDPGGASKRGKS